MHMLVDEPSGVHASKSTYFLLMCESIDGPILKTYFLFRQRQQFRVNAIEVQNHVAIVSRLSMHANLT